MSSVDWGDESVSPPSRAHLGDRWLGPGLVWKEGMGGAGTLGLRSVSFLRILRVGRETVSAESQCVMRRDPCRPVRRGPACAAGRLWVEGIGLEGWTMIAATGESMSSKE